VNAIGVNEMRAALRAAAGAATVVAAMVVAAAGTGAHAAARSFGPGVGGRWGIAREVPGTATLNRGGNAQVDAVSCGAPGACAAVGYLGGDSASSQQQAFVASETGDRWSRAQEVATALNLNGPGELYSVSCASAGNCTAGGYYSDRTENLQAFVVSEVNGRWGSPLEVPGTARLNRRGDAAVESVSCASAGNCSAGGEYADADDDAQAFVVSEVGGRWGLAQEVAGSLNKGEYASVYSVSCASAGNCSAGGGYDSTSTAVQQAFVVGEVNGRWGRASEEPGTRQWNQGGFATLPSVSCASAGNCGGAGFYTDLFGSQQAFVASEVNGRWHTAQEAPGTGQLNIGGNAQAETVSCDSPGNCDAGGYYTSEDAPRHQQAFVIGEVNGRWHTAQRVAVALNMGGSATIESVSCASPGDCGAGGRYTDSSGHSQALVLDEVNGTWGRAQELPGTAALNTGRLASVNSVSCTPAGGCSAGGYYSSSGDQQAFIDNQPPVAPSRAKKSS
jgi:hypothetical protein